MARKCAPTTYYNIKTLLVAKCPERSNSVLWRDWQEHPYYAPAHNNVNVVECFHGIVVSGPMHIYKFPTSCTQNQVRVLKMDGISAAASILALFQASQALGKAGKFLWSLRKIPEEIVSLRDELTSVEAVVGEATRAVKNLEASESRPSPGPLSLPATSNTLATIKKQAEDLEAAATDLGDICARFQKSSDPEKHPSKNSTTAGEGKGNQVTGKRQKARQVVNWLREKNKIEPIRQRIKLAKNNLSFCLQALNTVQS